MSESKYQNSDSTYQDLLIQLASLFREANSVSRNIKIDDSPSLDAFARLRVSNPTGLFDSQNQYHDNPILWENKVKNISGNAKATHNPDESTVDLIVGAGDEIIRQTRQYFRYQPGKSQSILITFVMDSQNLDFKQSVGYFDNEDGVFLLDNGANYCIVRRSSTSGFSVDEEIRQENWNIDPFDGSGPSGIVIDFEKAQILIIDLEWLGVGRVRVGFVVDGIPFYAHEFLNANSLNTVYMKTANLPVRYCANSGVSLSGSKTFKTICAQVSSEGGFEVARGISMTATNGEIARTVTNSKLLPLVSIRPRSKFNSIVNRGLIIPEAMAIYSGTVSVNFRLIWGGILTGGSWFNVNDESIVEANVGATAISGGIEIESQFSAGSNQSRGSFATSFIVRYPIALNIDGDHPTDPFTDVMTVAAISLGANTNSTASLNFREIR